MSLKGVYSFTVQTVNRPPCHFDGYSRGKPLLHRLSMSTNADSIEGPGVAVSCNNISSDSLPW